MQEEGAIDASGQGRAAVTYSGNPQQTPQSLVSVASAPTCPLLQHHQAGVMQRPSCNTHQPTQTPSPEPHLTSPPPTPRLTNKQPHRLRRRRIACAAAARVPESDTTQHFHACRSRGYKAHPLQTASVVQHTRWKEYIRCIASHRIASHRACRKEIKQGSSCCCCAGWRYPGTSASRARPLSGTSGGVHGARGGGSVRG